jgi:hypothetical protein
VQQPDRQDAEEGAHLGDRGPAELADDGGPREEEHRVDREEHVEECVQVVADLGLRPAAPDRVDAALVGGELLSGRGVRAQQPVGRQRRDDEEDPAGRDGADGDMGRL